MKYFSFLGVAFALGLTGVGCGVSGNAPVVTLPPETSVIWSDYEHNDLIRLTSDEEVVPITSPLVLTGEARGYWYFEASFPAYLYDADENQVAVIPVTAEGDWMTEEYVPFTLTLTFPDQLSGSEGTLVLQKDNPSGLPENDDQLVIPVVFE